MKSAFIKVKDTGILFAQNLTELEEENLSIILYQKNYKVNILDGFINLKNNFITDNTILINGTNSKIIDKINLQDYGNFTFEFKNDNITKLRTID